jgi:aryl-alcohol dehydrogenase-like predicted oxidoreductase
MTLQGLNSTMKYGQISGVEKPVSRLIIGSAFLNSMPETATIFDAYFERGGNVFDTSYGYGNPNGICERNLGQWVRDRGVRDNVVIIEKGANFPNNNPEGLTKELIGGLERLQMDWVDLYLIHRDNPEIPIEEWMDALNENWQAGRMKTFGVSNFSVERIEQAQEYARKKGMPQIACVSNQYSLAQMLSPVWAGCLSANDPEAREWFTRTQMPLLPWSSQARGFFTERASREDKTNEEFVRCWYSEENFQRKERAEKLAKEKGILPIHIALSWVLHQPFPTFPMIGPMTVSEVESSIRVLSVELSSREVEWLDSAKS